MMLRFSQCSKLSRSLSSQQCPEEDHGSILIPILQTRKQAQRFGGLAHGPTSNKHRRWDLSPGVLTFSAHQHTGTAVRLKSQMALESVTCLTSLAPVSGLEFPWGPKPFSEVIAGSLLRNNGQSMDSSCLEGSHVGVYFSAHWVSTSSLPLPSV